MDKPRYINAGGKLIDLEVPKVMGIVNVTPDSFYKGSRYNSEKEIFGAVSKMIENGADIIDVGGYSSRPGAPEITYEEERKRVLKAVSFISREIPGAIISVDTCRASIAREAVEESGAHIVNDISGGEADNEMAETIQKLNVPYIIMHMKGNPRTMQISPQYNDVVADILKWFGEKIFRLRSAGVKDIIIDPGFGFGKTVDHNFEMLNRLGDFSIAGLPLLIGVSRKSMVWKTLDIGADEALAGTISLNTVALLKGADILRVHDVKEAVQAVRLFCRLRKNGGKD